MTKKSKSPVKPAESASPGPQDHYSLMCLNRVRIPTYHLLRVPRGSDPDLTRACPSCGKPIQGHVVRRISR